jgi:hypothetical protein
MKRFLIIGGIVAAIVGGAMLYPSKPASMHPVAFQSAPDGTALKGLRKSRWATHRHAPQQPAGGQWPRFRPDKPGE